MNDASTAELPRTSAGGVVEPRLSGKAALAGILALSSLCGCVVALLLVTVGLVQAFAIVLVMPLLGVSGAAMGYLAMRDIRKSEGKLKGRVPALVGLFLGLLTASIQGAAGIGVLRTYMDAKNTLAPAMGRLFIALDRGEDATAERFLSQSSDMPGAARRSAMIGALRARFGACRGASFDLGTIIEGRDLASGSAKPIDPTRVDLPRTVRLVFEKGEALLLVWLDNPALEKGEVRMYDALVVLSAGGGAKGPAEVMLLRGDGPAFKVASGFGMKVVGY